MKDSPLAQNRGTTRLPFIDNLRTFLTILVVLVHASVTYGGDGSWYYKEGGATAPERILLTLFNALCQSFFMGLFFFLAGYFTPGSYDRKGGGAFLRDRLLRLGIPLLSFDLFLDALTGYFCRGQEAPDVPLLDLYVGYLRRKEGIGSGPLWFVEILLIFAIIYAVWRRLAGPPAAPKPGALPSRRSILLFAGFLSAGAFTVRLRFPIDYGFEPLNLQLPFCFQYVCAFAVGVVARRGRWLDGLTETAGRGWEAVAIAAVLALPVLLFAGGGAGGDVEVFKGGLRWQAFGAAVWESTAFLSISVTLLRVFRRRFAGQNRLGRECAASAYTVYVLHAPLLVFVSTAARGLPLPALVKFAAVSAVAVPLCFLAAGIVRRAPGLRRIL